MIRHDIMSCLIMHHDDGLRPGYGLRVCLHIWLLGWVVLTKILIQDGNYRLDKEEDMECSLAPV